MKKLRMMGLISVVVMVSISLCGCVNRNPPSMQSAPGADAVSGTIEGTDSGKTVYPTATKVMIPAHTQVATLTVTPHPTPNVFILDRSVSPGFRWDAVVQLIRSNDGERILFTVSSDDHRVEWLIEDRTYSDKDTHLRDYSVPYPLHWAKDGQYLYYVYRTSGDGCFTPLPQTGWGLYRVDLSTGKVDEITSRGGRWVSISPDEATVVIVSGDNPITVVDIDSKREQAIDPLIIQEEVVMATDTGNVVWSPDSHSIIISIHAGACDEELHSGWIVRLDVTTMQARTLIPRDERAFIPYAWVDPTKVLVSSKDGALWWMNPDNGEVNPVQ